MGLDMYLNKAPRYNDATMKDISAIESWLSWKNRKPEFSDFSFEKWSGRKLEDVKLEYYIDFYGNFYQERYYIWDIEHKYPVKSIIQEVGYWRKANHIHKWFVNNVQDGIDDCDYHREVTKEDLEKLLTICEEIKSNDDFTVAMEKLPTTSGFFFGGTEYDEWYMYAIEETIKICKKVLEETDFGTEMIYYRSSW